MKLPPFRKKEFQYAILVVASACLIFFPFLSWLMKLALLNSSTNYIIMIPVAAAIILYESRGRFNLEPEEGNSGAVLGAALMAISVCVFYTQVYVVLKLSAFIAYLLGCSVFFFGTGILGLVAKPVLYLFFMYPIPFTFLYDYGPYLSGFTGNIVSAALGVLGLNPVYSETPLSVISLVSRGGEAITFTIDAPCMGVFSLMSFLAFAVFLALMLKGSLLRKAVLMGLGVLLMLSLNVLRIFGICYVGWMYGSQTALETFHTFGGWLLFSVGMVIYLVVNMKLAKEKPANNEIVPVNPTIGFKHAPMGPPIQNDESAARNLFER